MDFSVVDFSVVDFSVVPPGLELVVLLDCSVVDELEEAAAGAPDASAGAPGTTVVVEVLVSFSVSVPLHPATLPTITANPINNAAALFVFDFTVFSLGFRSTENSVASRSIAFARMKSLIRRG